jgi:hypothetical protein
MKNDSAYKRAATPGVASYVQRRAEWGNFEVTAVQGTSWGEFRTYCLASQLSIISTHYGRWMNNSDSISWIPTGVLKVLRHAFNQIWGESSPICS